jgi:hypothetical protein
MTTGKSKSNGLRLSVKCVATLLRTRIRFTVFGKIQPVKEQTRVLRIEFIQVTLIKMKEITVTVKIQFTNSIPTNELDMVTDNVLHALCKREQAYGLYRTNNARYIGVEAPNTIWAKGFNETEIQDL